MNKRQLEVEKKKLAEEAKELNHLKAIYNKAAEDIAKNISITDGKMEVLLANWDDLSDADKSVYQSKIYQRNFQKQLQSQINDALKDLNSGQYKSISEYLEKCYETGYVGTMYDIAGQGIPIITPIDQKKVIRAMKTNSKISKGLYTKLGEDVDFLKKRIANNISRGIATADSYENIARNIMNDSKVGRNRAMTIVRTEGHRIHSNSAHDAQLAAKDAGADVVKQWDSTMDGKTRTTHRLLDGQLREVEEPFEMGGMKAMYPSDFGRPEEDINCRCVSLQRATWALDEEELETLKERAEYFELDKTNSFNDFRKKYLPAAEEVNIMPEGFVPAKTIKEATKVANDLGVKYAIYDDLPLGTANLFNEALMTLPDDARPVFVGSSKMLEKYRNAKLPRSSKNFYGVSIETDGIFLGTDASKAGAVKAFWDYDTYGIMTGISSSYKTVDKITEAKKIAQEAYIKKYGRKQFFNENGNATIYHEMGHVYATKRGLPEGFEYDARRWFEESKCDILKSPTEAWAEAWAAYHTKNTDLPDYISKYISAATKKPLANAGKSSIIKSIDIDDFEMVTYGKNIDKKVEETIFNTFKQAEKNGDFFISDVVVKDIADEINGTPVLQIEPTTLGTLTLNINKSAVAGKTLEEIDEMFANSKLSIANTLEEAIKHECGHAKLIRGMRSEEIEELYKELEKIHIEGISRKAYSDGAECIAEVEVLLFRGEEVPEEAMELYNKYMKRK